MIKNIKIYLVIFLGLVLVIIGYLGCYRYFNLPSTVGGDRDAYGCIGSAGYSFCQVKNKCLREWEEKCEVGAFLDVKNGTYLIEGLTVTLKDGYNEDKIAPESASKQITRYFGNDVVADFNGDGFKDSAFLLTSESGGSGTFYYVVVLLGGENKAIGTNAIFIGDRIAPQTTEFASGMIIVNYADRKPSESFSVSPSVGVSKYFKIVNSKLIEINLGLSESQAREIAEKSCIKGGESLAFGYYHRLAPK